MNCSSAFVTTSPASKRCGLCLRAFYACKLCGKQKPYSSQRPLRFELNSVRFCSNRCAGIWKFRQNETIRQTLASARIRGCQHPAWQARPQPNPKGQPRHEIMAEKNPNWRGGVSGPRKKEMGRYPYQAWRTSILRLDNMRCVLCGSGERLEANHIELWSEAPQKRYDESNGVTLCALCHRSICGHERQFEKRFKTHVENRHLINTAA